MLPELLSLLGDRWSVPVLIELGARGSTRRSDLRRAVGDVSQKVLGTCLGRLTTHGLVARYVETTSPISVSYDLTETGRSLLDVLRMLCTWADEHGAALSQEPAAPRADDA